MPPATWASDVNDAQIPSNAKPFGGPNGYGWDGTAHRAFRSDSNGIQRTTEEYPITSQRVAFTAAAAVAVTTGLKAIGNGYGISPYGRRLLRITATRVGSVSSPMYVYLYSSDDNVTYRPLLAPMGTSAAALGTNAIAALQDTAKVDTVMIAVPLGTTGVNHDAWYMIPSELNLGRYVQLWAKRDSSTVTAGTTATLGLTWELREQ